jgi:hypothetical protein
MINFIVGAVVMAFWLSIGFFFLSLAIGLVMLVFSGLVCLCQKIWSFIKR